jgi:hypothetical protein
MRTRIVAAAGLIALAAAPAALSVEVGDSAPSIRATKWYNNSGPVSMSKFKGQIVLLDFWATW